MSQGLCNIDSLVLKNSEKYQENGGTGTAELNRLWENSKHRSNFAVKRFPNF